MAAQKKEREQSYKSNELANSINAGKDITPSFQNVTVPE